MKVAYKGNVVAMADNQSPSGRAVSCSQILKWVEDCLPRAEMDVLVTPEIAATLLNFNRPGETNRPLSKAFVNQTAEAMAGGLWENTGEPIIISDTRVLNDGQHRLSAIVESGIPTIMDLRFGVPRHAFQSTNSGRKRSAGDVLGIMGVKNTAMCASIARMVIFYNRGLPKASGSKVYNVDVAKAVETWPAITEAALIISSMPRWFRSGPIGAVVFFALRTAVNRTQAGEFIGVLGSGEGTAQHPAHRWRELIIRAGGIRHDGDRLRIFANGIIAWNLFRRPQRDVDRMKWVVGTPFPKVEGLKL
jgi:hypothetical protein